MSGGGRSSKDGKRSPYLIDILKEEREMHTKGPWKIHTKQARKELRVAVGPEDSDANSGVCSINRLHDEWESNARLIAEAPAMLEALRGVVALSDRGSFPETPACDGIVDDARAIIARIKP